jgi:signal peptidase I
MILPILASQVAKIAGVSHQHPAHNKVFNVLRLIIGAGDVVGYVPSKYKVPNSNPSTTKKNLKS